MENLGQQLGIAPRQLQLIQNAAALAGVSTDATTSSIQGMAEALTKAGTGRAPEVIQQLQQLGYTNKQIDKLIKRSAAGDYVNLTKELSERFNITYTNVNDRREHENTFGWNQEFQNYTNKGSAEQTRLGDEATKNGLLSQSQFDKLSRLSESWTSLNQAVDHFKQLIGAELSVPLNTLFTTIRDYLTDAKTQKWISDAAVEGVKALNDGLKTAVDWLKDGGWESITSIGTSLGGMKTVAIAVGAVMAGPLVSATLALGGALLTLAANPVGLVITGLGALALAGYELYEHWGDVKAKFRELWDGLSKMWNDNTGYLRTAVEILFPIPAAIIKSLGKATRVFCWYVENVKGYVFFWMGLSVPAY